MKRRFHIAVLLIAAMLLAALTGCMSRVSRPRETPPASATASQNAASTSPTAQTLVKSAVDSLLAQYKTAAVSDEDAALLTKSVTLSAEALAAIEAACAVTTVYPYTDIMAIESALDRYNSLPEYTSDIEYGIVNSLPIDPVEFYNMVKANNDAYLAVNSGAVHKPLEDDYLMWVCEIVCDTLNREIPSIQDARKLGELDASLADLRILCNVVSAVTAYVSADNGMYISPVRMDDSVGMTGNAQRKEMVIAHETEHIIQYRCMQAQELFGAERAIGFSVMWADQPVNSMFYYWFIEAAAEILSSDLYDSGGYSYTDMIGYLDCLSYIKLLSGAEAKDTPRLSRENSIERVFEYFDCVTQEEQMELLQLFYAVEIITHEPDTQHTAGFQNRYEETCGRKFSDAEMLELKAAAGQTLSKYFYESLTRFTAETEMPLDEVMYIIATFEMNLNYIFRYDAAENMEPLLPMLEHYSMLQGLFFKELSAALEVTAEALNAAYEAYHCRVYIPYNTFMKGKEDWTGPELSVFSRDGNKFSDYLYFRTGHRRTAPIRSMLEIYPSINP